MGEGLTAVDQLVFAVDEAADAIRAGIEAEVAEEVIKETQRCLAWLRSGKSLAEAIAAIEDGLLLEGPG